MSSTESSGQCFVENVRLCVHSWFEHSRWVPFLFLLLTVRPYYEQIYLYVVFGSWEFTAGAPVCPPTYLLHWRVYFSSRFGCLHRVHRSVCLRVCVCVAGTASSRMRDSVFVPQRPSLSLSGLYCLSLGANTHQTSRPAFGFMSICWLD